MKLLKGLLVLFVTGVAFWVLYSDATQYLKVRPIEIQNKCEKSSSASGGTCKRNFNVSPYSETVGLQFKGVPERQTLVGKLSGLTPEILGYSIVFVDKSFLKFWHGQNSEIKEIRNLGVCNYPTDFTPTETGGYYIGDFGLLEVPDKIKELATTLNDCGQPILLVPPGTDTIEKTEKYEVNINLTLWSYLTLLILSLFFSALLLKTFEFLYYFIMDSSKKT